jgi:hypothetical protein
LDAGYDDVTVLDVAETALARTKTRLGRRQEAVDWIVADITKWRPGRQYDVWHDRAVFHFLTDRPGRVAYKTALRDGLSIGGIALIGTVGVDGPEKCSGLPVMRYSPQSLSSELGDAFDLLDERLEAHETPTGAIQHFQFSLFRRSS